MSARNAFRACWVSESLEHRAACLFSGAGWGALWSIWGRKPSLGPRAVRPSQGGQPLLKSSCPILTNLHRRLSREGGPSSRPLCSMKHLEGGFPLYLKDIRAVVWPQGWGWEKEFARRLVETCVRGELEEGRVTWEGGVTTLLVQGTSSQVCMTLSPVSLFDISPIFHPHGPLSTGTTTLTDLECTLLFAGAFLVADSKYSACNARDLSSIPGWGRSPGEGNGYALQCSCLENSMEEPGGL